MSRAIQASWPGLRAAVVLATALAIATPALVLTPAMSMSISSAEAKGRKKKRRRAKAKAKLRGNQSCLKALKRMGVRYKPAKRRGIAVAVRVTGTIAGVTYQGYKKKPLILDCSLVASLAAMGPHLTALGIERAIYSSSYQRRKVRGSSRWSKHSFGLAIDVHEFVGDRIGTLRVKDDFEQGLGDTVDCIGQPLTLGGGVLRTLYCQFERSGMFHSILTPDYDAGHYNHYHIEADPWSERAVVPPRP